VLAVCSLILSLLLLSAAPASAGQYSFRAELTCAQCSSYANVVAELTDSSRHPVSSGPINQNGMVELFASREGVYTFTVRTIDGGILHQETVHVGRHNAPVAVHIEDGQERQRPVSGTVSVARLQHKVPKKAKKEYNKAEEKLKEGDIQGSLDHLQKAIEIDPNYMEAHNNLGARYLMLGDVQKAYASFKRALDLDPDSPLVQVNMAISLLSIGDPKGAENAARRAMQLDPTDLKPKYMLGLALYEQQQYTTEAIDVLKKARERFPNANMALAVMQANTGNTELARQSLKEYIRNGNKEQRAKAEQMLASLK
jgi:tetratricopeptide (TPR) repeat protein